MDNRSKNDLTFYGGLGLCGIGSTMLIIKMFMVLGFLGGFGLLLVVLGLITSFNNDL